MVTVYAVGDDQFIEPNELQQLIESNKKELAAALGYSIISVESSKPTEDPMVTIATMVTTVTQTIPDWAIALIVIVNSVLVISLLLIVLGILWKCYTR